jgi:hypothetical protein
MLAPLLGATLLVLLTAALIASWRKSRAAQEKTRLDHERASFLADVSTAVAESLDASVALATVARLAVPFVADACVIDLADGEGGLARVAAVHADPAGAAAIAQHYRAATPMHPLLAQALRESKPRQPSPTI